MMTQEHPIQLLVTQQVIATMTCLICPDASIAIRKLSSGLPSYKKLYTLILIL